MTRVLALEWAGTGVTANAICPGVFATEMNRPLMNDPVKYKEFVAQIPMGRWGEVARARRRRGVSRVRRLVVHDGQLAVRRWWVDGAIAQHELGVGSRRCASGSRAESQSAVIIKSM